MRRLPPLVVAFLILVVAAAAAAAAPAADAATLHGRVLGRPHVGGGHATVPLMVAGRGAAVFVTVPARSGFRTAGHGRTSAARLRLGDVISTRVRSLRGRRARARYLRIDRRSSAPAFADLERRAGAAAKGAAQATTEIARIAQAEQNGPQDSSQLRFYLLGVRTQLNLLIADLRRQADGIDGVVRDVRSSSPASAELLLARLGRAASSARDAAQRLEDGVAGLDEFINSIGGLQDGGLPAGATDVVGAVVQTVTQVLGGLTGGAAPSVPNPVDGLPVPRLG